MTLYHHRFNTPQRSTEECRFSVSKDGLVQGGNGKEPASGESANASFHFTQTCGFAADSPLAIYSQTFLFIDCFLVVMVDLISTASGAPFRNRWQPAEFPLATSFCHLHLFRCCRSNKTGTGAKYFYPAAATREPKNERTVRSMIQVSSGFLIMTFPKFAMRQVNLCAGSLRSDLTRKFLGRNFSKEPEDTGRKRGEHYDST